jgi:hypothetical protein
MKELEEQRAEDERERRGDAQPAPHYLSRFRLHQMKTEQRETDASEASKE